MSKVNAISIPNSHCWQNFNNCQADFDPLLQFRFQPCFFLCERFLLIFSYHIFSNTI